jgi:diketogulonate reductase-like aldo/keto reductase
MKTISLHDGRALDVIGLGTWSMGGGSTPDPSQDGKALQALRWAFEMGYTHIDTAESYASGHSEELVGQALKEYDRSRFFITTKVSPPNLRYGSVPRALDGSLQRLGLDYIDLYLVHWPSASIPLSETFRALNQVVREGKVRYLGVSNFNLQQLKQSQDLSETPLLTNQAPYSLFTREYVRNGVLEYCQQNQVALTAYSPVKESRLHTNPVVGEIAAAHHATPYQIALAWLVQQPWVITIPMSQDREHLLQNWQAGEISLTEAEMSVLNGLAR